MTGTEREPTHSMERLARLAATQRVAEARAELDTLVQEQPEVAAQWYIVARLLLHGGADRFRQIQDGLIPLGLAPQRALQQAARQLDTLQHLELFLAQVRPTRDGGPRFAPGCRTSWTRCNTINRQEKYQTTRPPHWAVWNGC